MERRRLTAREADVYWNQHSPRQLGHYTEFQDVAMNDDEYIKWPAAATVQLIVSLNSLNSSCELFNKHKHSVP